MPGRGFTSFRRHRAQMVAPILCVLFGAPAQAADASAWANDMHSSMRLIAATAAREGGRTVFRAGIEVRLDKGWKTYWRYPGDSGVPPRFAFSQSENVQAVTVQWPFPQRFADDGGQSIGYKDRVIFPVRIEPKVSGKPVTLRLDLDYAVCEKLCVPAEGKAELIMAGEPNAHEALVAKAEARVPQKRKLGEPAALSIRAVTRATPTRIAVDVAAPPDANADLFVEGPTPDWALPVPAPVAGAPPGLKRFTFALDGLPPGASAKGAMLTLTAVTDDAAIEVAYRLD
jgi:DsbC/DsbD-like thiol-disulfide interchange protein